MATFAGSTSPAALAALAPSITNLAAAQRAKSQAAAGLMNTLGVQFEKQKEQEAKRQKNEAALEIAKGLIADPAFRRQMPGVTDAAGLVKVAGAENVLDFGIKTQQADRLAQQSAAQIALTQKQISEYDRQVKQREADLAAQKAEGEAFQQLVSAGGKLSDEQLGSVLSGLSPEAQVRAISLRNQLDPSKAYEIVDLPNGESALIYGNQMMRISTQEKSPLPDAYNKGLALIKEQFTEGTPEYDRAVQNLVDRTLGYDPSLGESAFGGQPAAAPDGPLSDISPRAVSFFEQIPEDRVTDVFLKNGQTTPEFDQYLSQLAEAGVSDDIISGVKTMVEQRAEEERMGRFARGEFGGEEESEKQSGFFKRLFSGGPGPGSLPGPADEFVPSTTVAARRRPAALAAENQRLKADQTAFKNAKELARRELIEKYKGKDKKQILEELEKARLDKIMSMPKTSAQTPAQRKVHELLKNIFQMPPFVEEYGLDELPSEIAKFVRDMIPVTERERLRRERLLNRNESAITPVE